MAERKTAAPKDEAQADVQKAVDEAEDKGYIGVPVDPTPKENYTVAGVLAGKPTPETDAGHAREVRQQLDDDARRR
ncbi:hypothetical protein [Streptomyces resistomycificus]|uniref:Uncharacterized protein n=1 Tax=Streptomyces resistomycificus TaxID=67356 RepID=A0A0L8L592_9ACTN|nr:hypothetical protein [Streptomyces resistomycificus]KOG33290.1 hypothetical protein ADK37_23170 [Streptomyces resistomycificus]KUN99491.1 hypothetical protein AQJ84_11120 [Streptomyces resistomycificus]